MFFMPQKVERLIIKIFFKCKITLMPFNELFFLFTLLFYYSFQTVARFETMHLLNQRRVHATFDSDAQETKCSSPEF